MGISYGAGCSCKAVRIGKGAERGEWHDKGYSDYSKCFMQVQFRKKKLYEKKIRCHFDSG